MDALVDAATTAARAFVLGDLGLLFEALHAQRRGLARLGDAAGAPIVTPSVAKLGEHASRQSAVVLPSGAGGGDITLFVGPEPPSAELLALRDRLGHERLDLRLEARGVQCIRNGET
jgi:phosphomevalonate kinase